MTLTDFLLARIAEDEAAAHALGDEPGREWWHVTNEWLPPLNSDAARFAARLHPTRVLAECEAKRRVVGLHSGDEDPSDCPPWGRSPSGLEPCSTLRALALPYADHPDYREEWRP